MGKPAGGPGLTRNQSENNWLNIAILVEKEMALFSTIWFSTKLWNALPNLGPTDTMKRATNEVKKGEAAKNDVVRELLILTRSSIIRSAGNPLWRERDVRIYDCLASKQFLNCMLLLLTGPAKLDPNVLRVIPIEWAPINTVASSV